MGQFEPTLKILSFFLVVIFIFFGIFLGYFTLIIKCLYMMMALKVHRSQYSAILCDILTNVFVAVDTITLYYSTSFSSNY